MQDFTLENLKFSLKNQIYLDNKILTLEGESALTIKAERVMSPLCGAIDFLMKTQEFFWKILDLYLSFKILTRTWSDTHNDVFSFLTLCT